MIGIDAKIQRLQAIFTRDLFTSYTYTSNGRAYLNQRDGETVPEVLSGSEYSEVLLDDSIAGHSFFVVENDYDVINGVELLVDVSIYFAVNLSTVYPSVTERATEYLHRDVLDILKNESFEATSIVSGREAFSDFDIKVGDNMQPFYLVRFNTTVQCNIKECVIIPT